jgi:putative membrane protein
VPLAVAAEVASTHPWRWQPHPEVWLLVASLVGLWVYAIRRIGPTAVRGDERVVTGGQVAWFIAAVVVLLGASGWPLHDIGEEYLYSAHMVQHLLLSFVLPPLVWWATPTWLARLVIGNGRAYGVLKRLARPVPATLVFNGVVVLTHWPALVNASVETGPLHYGVHVLVVAAALLMWLPVCGPFAELRFSLPVQMIYLFLQSIIPTLPSAWLINAETPVYRAYDSAYRLWGISVLTDQQTAGLIMKVAGGFYLWTIITVLFFKFVARSEGDDRYRGAHPDRRAPRPDPDVLTWDQVERELERAGPPPPEP